MNFSSPLYPADEHHSASSNTNTTRGDPTFAEANLRRSRDATNRRNNLPIIGFEVGQSFARHHGALHRILQNMVANVANCGRFVWCQNDPFCLNTGHCPKNTGKLGQKGRLDNCETVTEPLTSRGRFLLCAMATNGEPRGNRSVEPFLAEVFYGVEDRRPGPTPQVGCPVPAKDRVNTMSTSPQNPIPAGLPVGSHEFPLHPEFFQVATRKTLLHNGYGLEAWLFPGGHTARFGIRTKLCHRSPLRRGHTFQFVG